MLGVNVCEAGTSQIDYSLVTDKKNNRCSFWRGNFFYMFYVLCFSELWLSEGILYMFGRL